MQQWASGQTRSVLNKTVLERSSVGLQGKDVIFDTQIDELSTGKCGLLEHRGGLPPHVLGCSGRSRHHLYLTIACMMQWLHLIKRRRSVQCTVISSEGILYFILNGK